MRMGMVIDLDRCVGCQTCAMVCKIHNACPPKTWWNRVSTIGAKTHHAATLDKDGNPRMDFLPLSCQHCEDAPCQRVCPTGATYTSEDGTVLVDYEKCIGCRFCFSACPYGVRQFNWEDPAKLKDGYIDDDYGYPFDYREGDDQRLVYTKDRPKGVTEKCTFCAEYVAQGVQPACVRACPQKARIFGDLDDPDSEVSKKIAAGDAVRLHEEYGTNPKVYYVVKDKEVLAHA